MTAEGAGMTAEGAGMTGRGREIKKRRKKGEGLDEIGDEIGVETPNLGVWQHRVNRQFIFASFPHSSMLKFG